MKLLALAVTLLTAGAAFADGPFRHHRGGGAQRGGGDFHGARPAGGGWRQDGWRGSDRAYPRPVYVAPRPVYVAPRPRYNYAYPTPRVVVMPQVNLAPRLPYGTVTVYVGQQAYLYGGGAFYAATAQGYVVVAPPLGAVISELPPGATMQFIDGYTWATTNDAWFFWDGNVNAWVVAQGPY